MFVQCDVMSTKLDFPIPGLLSSLLPGDSISRLLEPQGREVFFSGAKNFLRYQFSNYIVPIKHLYESDCVRMMDDIKKKKM